MGVGERAEGFSGETGRSRKIIHIDMDAFYASVEQRDNPELRGKPLYAVGSFDPDHDAVMRIGGETPGGGPILSVGIKCQVRIRIPPPRISIRQSC